MPRKKKGQLVVKRWDQFTAWYVDQANLTAQNSALALVREGVTRDLGGATSVLRTELQDFFQKLEKVLRAGVLRMDQSARQSAGAKAIVRPNTKIERILNYSFDVPATVVAAEVDCSEDWVREVRRKHRGT